MSFIELEQDFRERIPHASMPRIAPTRSLLNRARREVLKSAVVDAVTAGVEETLEPQTETRARGLPGGLTRVEGELARVAHEQRRGRRQLLHEVLVGPRRFTCPQ
jgi:hypothetical protein